MWPPQSLGADSRGLGRLLRVLSLHLQLVVVGRPSTRLRSGMGRGVLYCSTRGGVRDVTFEEVVLGGLAPDRGLYVPQEIPHIPLDQLEKLRDASFVELASYIMRLFIGPDDIPPENLRVLIESSTKNFRVHEVCPVRKVGPTWILELFHGPTFAFKDVALQLLGNLFEYFLSKKRGADAKLTVLGATSGDTGSAAIYGLRGKKNINVFMLFPKGRVSEVQEKQMTTVLDDNVHCIAIDGTFDDCQAIVKDAFQDVRFRDAVRLGAVNSINWARVLAQITYYFYAYFRVTSKEKSLKRVSFSVPTGNFGDILAGYYAKNMGLPVDKLIVATNSNDILHRFFTTGKYWKQDIQQTLSPSMDITISSNFERLLFDLAGRDPTLLKAWMDEFECTSKLTLTGGPLLKAREDFLSARVDEQQTLETIQTFFHDYGYVLCPHTAVGVCAAAQLNSLNHSTICLATAHHAKFAEATKHLQNLEAVEAVPFQLRSLEELPTRAVELPANVFYVKRYLEEVTKGRSGGALLGFLAFGNYFWGRRWFVGATAVVGAVVLGVYLRRRRR